MQKGQRVIVQGRLLVRRWETADGRSGVNVEIEATSVGPDLAFGTTTFSRTRSDVFSPPVPAEAAAVAALVEADGVDAEGWAAPGVESAPRPANVDADGVVHDPLDASPSRGADLGGRGPVSGGVDPGVTTAYGPFTGVPRQGSTAPGGPGPATAGRPGTVMSSGPAVVRDPDEAVDDLDDPDLPDADTRSGADGYAGDGLDDEFEDDEDLAAASRR